MSPLGREEGRHVSALQARLQACVDQVVGYATIVGENVGGLVGDHFEQHILTMGELLQELLDDLGGILGQPSPATDVEGAAWVLKELTRRKNGTPGPSTGTDPSKASTSASASPSPTVRAHPGPRWI